MAQSPAHRFGQMIGELLEGAIAPLLAQFAVEHGLYLDQKEPRPCRTGRKCTWADSSGNTHDLDFVLERGGDKNQVGTPVAFIETAWRRYTKHSRNKVQEIQDAILPLAQKHEAVQPFKGAILAGVFTKGALDQLRSLGFSVVYISYHSIVAAFKKLQIPADFDEDTSDSDFSIKVRALEELSTSQRNRLKKEILKQHRPEIDQFLEHLSIAVMRRIEMIVVLVLHGGHHESPDVSDAIVYIQSYQEDSVTKPVIRYEIQVRYSNGDSIVGTFQFKDDAIQFLNGQEAHAHKAKG